MNAVRYFDFTLYCLLPNSRRGRCRSRADVNRTEPKFVHVLDLDLKAGQRNLIRLMLCGGFTSDVKISFVSTLVKLCARPEDKRVCGCLHL